AASNIGSFCGLIFYPLLVEPLFPVATQRLAWSAGYALLVLLAAWCALSLPRSSAKADAEVIGPVAWRVVAKWVFLAAVPSGLLLAAVAIHRQLYDRRPDPAHLTGFYLAMAAGGALGGIFAALIAPLIFDWTYEYPILVVAAAWILGGRSPFPWLQNFWRSET